MDNEVKKINEFVRRSQEKNKAVQKSAEKSFREITSAALEEKKRNARAKSTESKFQNTAKFAKYVLIASVMLVLAFAVSQYFSYYRSMTKDIKDYYSTTPDNFAKVSKSFGNLVSSDAIPVAENAEPEQKEKIEEALNLLRYEAHELSCVTESMEENDKRASIYSVTCKTREYELEFLVKYKDKKCVILGVESSKNEYPLDI